ncbi:MAG TPA: right-handed parallel beta-helix repeat-containing protein [Bacteroidia bacterium]
MKKIFFSFCLLLSAFCNAQKSMNVDTISIFVTDYDMQKLENLRNESFLGEDKGDLKSKVPCVVDYKHTFMSATIRLKGDRKIHYEDGNASYRIELAGENTILKMKRFSLHKARAKNYVYESLFHKALKRENLIGLTYKFVKVFINNKDAGIYALEEFMDVDLIEASRRREGPILHFSEDKSAILLDSMDVETFGSEPKAKSKKRIYVEARKQLTDFRNGKLQVGQVFDRKKLGDFFALTDVLGFHHGAVSKSVRYYFNPITEKMEPIGFDGHYGTEGAIFIAAEMGIDPEVGWFYRLYHDWFYLFFSNPKTFDADFFSSYMSSLKRMSETKYLDSLFADLGPSIDSELKLLQSDNPPLLADHIVSFGPDTFHFSKADLYARQVYMRNLIANKKRINTALVSFKGEDVKIGVRNFTPLPVEFLSVTQDGKKTLLDPSFILLPSKLYTSDSTYSILDVHIPGYDPKKNITIEYSVLGLHEPNSDTVIRRSSVVIREVGLVVRDRMHDPDAFRKNYSKYPFVTFNDTLKQFEIIKGKWVFKAPESFPMGYTLVIHEGAEIDFQKHAYLVSYSPVKFIGTQKEPIRIFSSDSSGGLFINAGGRKSELEYVEFKRLAPPSQNDWVLSGAVTFNESPVSISRCTFINMKSEDGINIVRSQFSMSNTTFKGTLSDGLDLDFSDGTVTNCTFNNCGNDGIDGSGSTILVENTTINHAGDKGISSGEESNITAVNCTVNDSKIGFASKDQSVTTLKNCTIHGCIYGLVALQKKSKFGPGIIKASNLKIENVPNNYLIEERSTCIIDGKPINTFSKNVRFTLYDIY